MTFAQLKLAVNGKIGLDSAAAGVDDVELSRWLNEGVRDLLLRTRCYISSETMALTAGFSDYRLPATILKITEAYGTSTGTAYEIISNSAAEVLRRRRSSGSGFTRYLSLQGHDLLMVYPTPTAPDVLTIYYVPRPTEMSSGAHDPADAAFGGIPVEFQKAIEFYALAEAADYDDDATSSMGDRYRQLYEAEIVRIKKSLQGKLGRMSRIPIPPRGQRGYLGSPDTIGV